MSAFHASTGFFNDLHNAHNDATEQRELAVLATVRSMSGRLHEYIQLVDLPVENAPTMFFLREAHGRPHRVVLINAEGLRDSSELTFVAFFGEKRAHADHASLDALDTELIREFHAYPHLLSYSSLELPDGNWANLVLMSSPDGVARWAESQRHAHAAQTVAPTCYTGISLYRGVIHGGLGPTGTAAIVRTKRFNFVERVSG